jgi:hypothetical protein
MKRKRKESKYTRRHGTVTNEQLAQDFSFCVPILPGDASLIEDFLADIDIQLRKDTGTTAHGLRLLHVGPALFSLVILRVYLNRSHENDRDIFQLVKQNRIHRVWTPHEQALAACHGESNTGLNFPFVAPPTPLLYGIAVVHDSELEISDEELLVTIESLESVHWTSSTGLSGGTRKPRRYRPPPLQSIPARWSRPKPRPAHGGTQVRFSSDTVTDESDDLKHLRRSKRTQVTPK